MEEDDSSADLQINARFAQEYQSRKQREELTRYEKKHDEEDSEDSDDSSTEEDEDGALLTTRLDIDILKTIHAIRTKDPKIYNPQVQFFHGESYDDDNDDERKQPSKPKKRYQDVVREQILEQMNSDNEVGSDDDDDDHAIPGQASYDASRLAYDEQQQQARQDFLQSTRDMEEEEEFLPVRKSKPAEEEDAATKAAFDLELERLKELRTPSDRAAATDWKDPRGEISNGYDYLLHYFEKRPWKKKEAPLEVADEDDASSLPDVEQADEFEATYNFRFETDNPVAAPTEEPPVAASGADHSNIPYARSLTMETLRRKDDRRVQKRQERLERKALERKIKEEQLKRLKNAKRQEMNQKLQQIRAVLGSNEDSEAPMDEAAIFKLLEEDYDPEKFESIMAGICSDDYYHQQETEWKDDRDVRKSLSGMEDGELLVGPDDDHGGLYDTIPENENDEPDSDLPAEENEDWVEEEEWPEDAPVEHEMERKIKAKMEEELYKLDYEDIVAGIPTRFKYRSVPANNYGLSTMEILCARDTTLKQYVSLKKLAPYADQEYVVRPRKRQKFRQLVQQEVEEELAEAEAPLKKKRKKKSPEAQGDDTNAAAADDPEPPGPKASKRKRRRKSHTDKKQRPVQDARLAAYGL